MKLGIDNIKLPESKKRGPLASLDHVKELGLSGIFFSTALDMSPTLDMGELRDIRAKADELGLYLESGVGKINPYCSAEEPALRAAGDGDIIGGFTRMIEASAAIGCFELWVAPETSNRSIAADSPTTASEQTSPGKTNSPASRRFCRSLRR